MRSPSLHCSAMVYAAHVFSVRAYAPVPVILEEVSR